MIANAIKEALNKIPVGMVAMIAAAYYGYHYYTFTYDGSSELFLKKTELENLSVSNSQLETKARELDNFLKNLEQKKGDLTNLARELDGMKATLNTEIDIPSFIKMVITEAKKVGLAVTSIKPTTAIDRESYHEQAFDMNFKGVYFQLMVFLDRLSNVKNIVRVDNFDIRPIGTNQKSQYVELEGTIQIKTYSYLGTKADEIARNGGNATASVPNSEGNSP